MKLYLNVIFIAAIAASTGDGCSTTPDEGAVMSKEQIVELLSDNTVNIKGSNIFAYTLADGTMKGLNTETGGTTGKWWVTNKDELCADWLDDELEKPQCDKMVYGSGSTYLWFNTSLEFNKGNTQDL
jgi:hypothetical protein